MVGGKMKEIRRHVTCLCDLGCGNTKSGEYQKIISSVSLESFVVVAAACS